MKIGVIGANGKAGALISKEAIDRGHVVTAIVREKSKVESKGFHHILEKNIYDLIPSDLSGLDAVISAYGLPFGEEHYNVYKNAIAKLIEVFKQLPDVRLLIVGGAASLYTDPRKKHRFLDEIPEAWRRDPADMAEGFKLLQQADINWTYFSPAYTFDYGGKRTGTYTLGGDFAITNSTNESYISYADYAVAMVDEVENAFHVRRRFTAVSDSKPDEAPKAAEPPKAGKLSEPARSAQVNIAPDPAGYFGIYDKEPTFEGISQYRSPLNYELAGKEYKLIMNTENDFYVKFISGTLLEWSVYGQPASKESYECGKTDELTYFVNFELTDVKPRTNITLVVDLEQRLVTYARSTTNFNDKYPYLVKTEFDFGALEITGYQLPFIRHGYTSDLVGKRILWHYAPRWEIIHVYYSPYYMRGTFPPGSPALLGMTPPTPEEAANFEKYPYDEPTSYIKIKDGIYLVSCIEQNMSRRGATGNSLLFLMDVKRLHDVGRSFGHAGQKEGNVHGENYLFSAYGEFVYSDGSVEDKKNVYIP
ncbi:MAG: NAD(P)H-binding protein [Clostridiales bacterium]|jgi:putative NADH-flavin reductase|nr:NAD(P)H-binding protein [Clostridiales bacterium]